MDELIKRLRDIGELQNADVLMDAAAERLEGKAVEYGSIRHYAKSAINGFETLDTETAIENAKSDLTSILRLIGAENLQRPPGLPGRGPFGSNG